MGADRAILCADIGTSSLKAALIDLNGRLSGFVREPYPASRVILGTVLAADWEEAFRRAVRALLFSGVGASGPAETGLATAPELAAICISGNGPTLIPVTEDEESLPPLHWHDGRREGPAPRAGSAPAAGKAPSHASSLFLPHAAWLLRHAPEDYNRTRWLLSSQEWLSRRLGAETVTVLPAPTYAPFYWDREQCGAYGLDIQKFPPFVDCGALIGAVSAQGEKDFALGEGTPIVAGGPDFIMALVGVGAVEPGIVCDRAGTSEGINVCALRPAKTAELRSLPHLKEGLWNVGAMLPTTGRLFEWFRNITGQQDRDYAAMLEEIVGLGSEDFAGGYFFPNIQAEGGLSLSSAFISTAGLTSRPELGKSVLEAIGFMVRGAIDKLERHGYRIEGMRLSGGQAKNPRWNQLKADISGRCLSVPTIPDGELAGDASMAMLALGEVRDLGEAIENTVRLGEVYEPDQRAYAVYSERYDAYRALQNKMEKFLG